VPDFKPFIVIGLALGGVYAMSGVGLVVLFRTTGVLNLAYGAVGALGSLVAFTLIDHEQNEWMAYGVAIMLAGVLTLIYGLLLGPPLANRDPLVKASASLGFALILLGFMQWRWTADVRSLALPTSDWQYTNGWLRITWTQAIGVIFPVAVTIATTIFLKRNKTGAAMRALADDRDNTALLGVPVRRMVFHEITRAAIQEALASPRDIDEELVEARPRALRIDLNLPDAGSFLVHDRTRIDVGGDQDAHGVLHVLVDGEGGDVGDHQVDDGQFTQQGRSPVRSARRAGSRVGSEGRGRSRRGARPPPGGARSRRRRRGRRASLGRRPGRGGTPRRPPHGTVRRPGRTARR